MRSSVQTTGMSHLGCGLSGNGRGPERAQTIAISSVRVQRPVEGQKTGLFRAVLTAFGLALILICTPRTGAAERVLILSAASAAPALRDILATSGAATSPDVRVSVASSGTLARQIERGAPADIYISAAPAWIELLDGKGLLDREFIRPLVRNRLVLVGPMSGGTGLGMLDVRKPLALLSALDGGRLALGNPAHVPAGLYGKAALENLGLWPAVRDRLALQANVRAVLAMVERGETPLGLVYATDAALSPHVRVRGIIPADAHPPIAYFAAVLSGRATSDVLAVFESLFSARSRTTLERYGFAVERYGFAVAQ
jgi:molybdate transport system substrate-binding protein